MRSRNRVQSPFPARNGAWAAQSSTAWARCPRSWSGSPTWITPRTRRAYRNDVKEFTAFAGVERPEETRQVTRAHLIAWLEGPRAPRACPELHPAKTRRDRLAL